MSSQQQQQEPIMLKQRRHGGVGSMIAFTLLLQGALILQFQHCCVRGQITDPSTVQIGDTIWYVAFISVYF